MVLIRLLSSYRIEELRTMDDLWHCPLGVDKVYIILYLYNPSKTTRSNASH